ncbi:MAG: ThuA domain-containing protein [Pirellulales bacterium]
MKAVRWGGAAAMLIVAGWVTSAVAEGETPRRPDGALAGGLAVRLRQQTETAPGTGRFHVVERTEEWRPQETAIIVCDVWDYHHCLNAVRRLEEFVPRLDALLKRARERGVTIIHAPSDCLPAYASHPARLRAQGTPPAPQAPPDVDLWCSRIPAEERAVYPIDQSDGGEDDDPAEHAQWVTKLRSLGRNPALPWKAQSPLITIDEDRDYLSDRGDEIWNVLERRQIRQVILAGVHTNMCVLGRPFGLRQMVRGGKQVALLRDLTDCMYNPARWPYVSHFAGNDLIISHVERYVCPTLTSDQILGGQPFRFAQDRRPHLVVVMAEDGYGTDRTLPALVTSRLLSEFRVTLVFGSAQERHQIPGLAALDDADALLLSVRRRALPQADLERIRRFVAAGKPVIGLRTANHAFQLKDETPPAGHAEWPDFDVQVFGGQYLGHPAATGMAQLGWAASAAEHPLARGRRGATGERPGDLYNIAPLAAGAQVVWTGQVAEQPPQPVAWTFTRADGGRSFYTSLGEEVDFGRPEFVELLVNAIRWAGGVRLQDPPPQRPAAERWERHWTAVPVPASLEAATQGELRDFAGTAWYRCVVRVGRQPDAAIASVRIPRGVGRPQVWWNGQLLAGREEEAGYEFPVAAAQQSPGDANLLVVRLSQVTGQTGLQAAPELIRGSTPLALTGRWQLRVGDDSTWSNMPLPAKFGTATEIVYEP